MFSYDDSLNDHLIIRTLRIPRTMLGLIVGVALGLAGAVMQGVLATRWPTRGSSGSTPARRCSWSSRSTRSGSLALGYVWFAFIGAALAPVAVCAFGSFGRGVPPP